VDVDSLSALRALLESTAMTLMPVKTILMVCRMAAEVGNVLLFFSTTMVDYLPSCCRIKLEYHDTEGLLCGMRIAY